MSNFILLNISCSPICALETPYIVCQKKKKGTISKRSIISHGTIWNTSVSSLPYNDSTPWVLIPHCWLFLAEEGQCPDSCAAVRAHLGSPARATSGRVCGCRGAAVPQAGWALSSLPIFSHHHPALQPRQGLQMSKETNVCCSSLCSDRWAAGTFSWHLSVVPKEPTLSRLPSSLSSHCRDLTLYVCVRALMCLCGSWYPATEIDRNQKSGSSKAQISDPELQWLICANTDLDRPDRLNRRKTQCQKGRSWSLINQKQISHPNGSTEVVSI